VPEVSATLARPVSLPLQASLFFKAPLALFGAIFFLFGSIFPVVFGANSDLTSLIHFRDSDPTVPGILVDERSSGASSNRKEIFEYRYRYTVGATAYEGRSYSGDSTAEAGQPVLVQYVPGKPGLSRIQGMRAKTFEWYVAVFAMVFPAIGFGMLYFSYLRFARHLHLLRFGLVAMGSVTRKTATSTQINDQVVYQVFFKFKDGQGIEHEACVSSHQVDELGDEKREPLLYDPANPSCAVLLDALPPEVRRQLTALP
jgi:hypothetical protein